MCIFFRTKSAIAVFLIYGLKPVHDSLFQLTSKISWTQPSWLAIEIAVCASVPQGRLTHCPVSRPPAKLNDADIRSGLERVILAWYICSQRCVLLVILSITSWSNARAQELNEVGIPSMKYQVDAYSVGDSAWHWPFFIGVTFMWRFSFHLTYRKSGDVDPCFTNMAYQERLHTTCSLSLISPNVLRTRKSPVNVVPDYRELSLNLSERPDWRGLYEPLHNPHLWHICPGPDIRPHDTVPTGSISLFIRRDGFAVPNTKL